MYKLKCVHIIGNTPSVGVYRNSYSVCFTRYFHVTHPEMSVAMTSESNVMTTEPMVLGERSMPSGINVNPAIMPTVMADMR